MMISQMISPLGLLQFRRVLCLLISQIQLKKKQISSSVETTIYSGDHSQMQASQVVLLHLVQADHVLHVLASHSKGGRVRKALKMKVLDKPSQICGSQAGPRYRQLHIAYYVLYIICHMSHMIHPSVHASFPISYIHTDTVNRILHHCMSTIISCITYCI